MIKPSYGVIVGRFQVNELHDGHMELFRAVRARHNRVLVFVGVSPTGSTKRNPLDFETRKRMIQAKFPEFTVLPLKDVMTDEMWSKSLDEKIREVVDYGDVTLYGGRDSFVPHYHGSYTPVELALPPGTLSGEDIRAALTNNVMESSDFRAGVIYAAMNARPRVVTTVDAIIWHAAGSQVDGFRYEFLLGKKAGEPGWRFVGGHAEAFTESFEDDVRREVMEETGLDIDQNHVHYIGSCIVPDWRWEKEESKIKTLIFACEALQMGATAADDIQQVRWVRSNEMSAELFVPTHRPLFKIVQRYFTKHFKDLEFKNAGTTSQSAVAD